MNRPPPIPTNPDSNSTQLPQLNITAPTRCLTCGDKKDPEIPGWFGINLQAIGAAGVFLFACLKCHAVYVNIESAGNSEIVNEFRERVLAEQEKEMEKSRIILSG